MDVDHHPLAVDISDLQGERFRDPQAAGVDGGKASVVMKCVDTAQKPEGIFTVSAPDSFR